jgi:hypothetical protein
MLDRGWLLGLLSVPLAASMWLVQDIPMGTTEMKGGSTKIGEVDPAVCNSDGTTNATGILKNKIDNVTVTDLDITIQKGTATSLVLAGNPPINVTFDAGKAHADYAAGGGLTNNDQGYEVKGLKGDADQNDGNIVINVTPSSKSTILGSVVNCNILAAYRFSAMSDLTRNGISELHHGAALAMIYNEDRSGATLTEIAGTVSFPGASANLTAVHLLDEDGDLISGASVSLNGLQFTISGFTALQEDDFVRVVMVFSEPLDGAPMRAQIQATFQQ